MNFFGVGTTEMLIILVVLLVVFGPKELPEVAKKIGGKVGEFRRLMDTANDEMASMLETAKKLEDLQGIQPASPRDAAPAMIPNTSEAANTIMPPRVSTMRSELPPPAADEQLLSASSSLPNTVPDPIISESSEPNSPTAGSQ